MGFCSISRVNKLRPDAYFCREWYSHFERLQKQNKNKKETLCGPQSLKHLLAEKEKVCQLFLLLKTIFSY